MPSEYVHEGTALVKHRQIDQDHLITLRADGIRQERTGTHARLHLLCNAAVLAWSNFNVERDEDRVRLVNSAYTHLDGLTVVYPKTRLKYDIDQFCAGLWEAHLESTAPVEQPGLERAAPDFLLRPFILAEGGTIIFGPPGRGKSYALMLMAVSMDAGLSDVWPSVQSKVLFINLERGGQSVGRRLGNVNAALGLDRHRTLGMINARGKSLVDIVDSARRYVQEHDVKCAFVDSISRAGGGDLTNNEDVNRICDMLNSVAPAWVGLAHTPRSDETHLFGGVHFEAAADLVVQLLSQQEEEGPLGIGLQITKENDVGRQPQWIGALEFDGMGLTAVRKARRGEFPEVEGNRRMTMKEATVQHLLEMGAQDVYDIQEATGFSRTKLATLLANDEAFVKLDKIGHRQRYGVKNGR